ncbi:unnamed protein product, partial [Callosobruchus maculatus]
MGPEAYDTLCDKLAPDSPDDRTYNEVVQMMDQFYNPCPLEIAEIFRFQSRKQQEGETVQEYYYALQKLSINCKFGEYLKMALRNQFVYGLHSRRIQSRLLETRDLTLDRAVEISTSMEMSERDANQLHRKTNSVDAIVQKDKRRYPNPENKATSRPSNSKTVYNSYNNANKFFCYRCGDNRHLANKCNMIDAICNFCKRKG